MVLLQRVARQIQQLRRINVSAQRNETETKQFENCFETVLLPFQLRRQFNIGALHIFLHYDDD